MDDGWWMILTGWMDKRMVLLSVFSIFKSHNLELAADVEQIAATASAFAAIKKGGRV